MSALQKHKNKATFMTWTYLKIVLQLAAFRKKRAKKKKAESDAGVSMDSTQNSANGTGDGSLANVSSLSDLNSITGEVGDIFVFLYVEVFCY